MTMNKYQLNNRAMDLRRELDLTEYGPIDIFNAVAKIEYLTLILAPLGKKISGVCYKGKRSSVIAINSNMSKGRQNFSLAHELYHLKYDDNGVNNFSLIDDNNQNKVEEKEADQFASYLLISQSSLRDTIQKYKDKKLMPLQEIIKLEQYYNVSHKAMVYRLKDEGIEVEKDSGKISLEAARLGFNRELYESSTITEPLVLGYYINRAETLLAQDLISSGKYDELLLDAYRADIVFGLDEEQEDNFE